MSASRSADDSGERPTASSPATVPAVRRWVTRRTFDQRVREAEEAEREQERRDAAAQAVRLNPPARISNSLTNSGDGGRPGERAEREPRRPSVGSVRATPVTAWPRARRRAQERARGVEAERLCERVPGDVDDDAGERERGPEADPERDDAHVLEARVGEQPLPRQRSPQERDGDQQRGEPKADEDAADGAGADRRRERMLRPPGDEQDGREAAPRRGARTRGPAPPSARREASCAPAPSRSSRPARREAARRRRAPPGRRGRARERCQESAPTPPGTPAASMTIRAARRRGRAW